MADVARLGRARGDRGIALVVALGVLFLLTVFAISFAQVTALERSASANHMQEVAARSVARGGIDAMIGRVREYARAQPFCDVRPGTGCPITIPGDPAQDRPFNEALGDTFGAGDAFEVRAYDCSGQINVNDFVGEDAVLTTILTNLGLAIQALQGANPLPASEVTNIIERRRGQPNQQYQTKNALAAAFDSRTNFEAASPYLAVASYREPAVIRPGNATGGAVYPRAYESSGAYAGLRTLSLSPINVNTASREVLEAILAGVTADVVAVRSTGQFVKAGFTAEFATVANETITQAEARAIAQYIANRRSAGTTTTVTGVDGPFKSFEELEDALLNDGASPISGNARKVGLVMAVADPNPPLIGTQRADPALLAGMVIDPNTREFIERSHLQPGSARPQFTLHATGYFEMVALGRILLGPAADLVAEVRESVIAQVFMTLKHTTQADFERAYRLGQGTGTGTVALTDARDFNPGYNFELHPEARQRTTPNPPPACEFAGWIQMATASRAGFQLRLDGDEPIRLAFDGEQTAPTLSDWTTLSSNPMTLLENPNNIPNGRDERALTEGVAGSEQDPGDFGPDGMRCWRVNDGTIDDILSFFPAPAANARDAPLSPDAGPVNIIAGGVEFWVRLFTDGTLGSDESLVQIVRLGPINDLVSEGPPEIRQANLTNAGLALRLERYGTELRAALFYWGLDTEGSMPPEELLVRQPRDPGDPPTNGSVSIDATPQGVNVIYVDRVADISSWRAGEWHQVLFRWGNLTEDAQVKLIVDGDEKPGQALPAVIDDTVTNTSTVTTTTTTVLVPGPNGQQIPIEQTEEVETITTTSAVEAQLFLLRSHTASQRLHVGGYTDLPIFNSAADLTLFGVDNPLPLYSSNEFQRFSNAVVDDFVLYGNADFAQVDARASDVRFPDYNDRRDNAPQRCAFVGAFELPDLGLPANGSPGEIGAVYYTARRPLDWAGTPSQTGLRVQLGVDGGIDQTNGLLTSPEDVGSLNFDLDGNDDPVTDADITPNPVDFGEIPSGFTPARRTIIGTRIAYRVHMRNGGGGAREHQNVTPIFEDITITVFPKQVRIVGATPPEIN